MLLTLNQAKSHLRVDGSDDDADITLKLEAAELATFEFMNRIAYATQAEVDAADPADQPILVNAAIKAAILLTLGHLYANREDVVTGVTVTALPMGACSLLQPYRVGMGV